MEALEEIIEDRGTKSLCLNTNRRPRMINKDEEREFDEESEYLVYAILVDKEFYSQNENRYGHRAMEEVLFRTIAGRVIIEFVKEFGHAPNASEFIQKYEEMAIETCKNKDDPEREKAYLDKFLNEKLPIIDSRDLHSNFKERALKALSHSRAVFLSRRVKDLAEKEDFETMEKEIAEIAERASEKESKLIEKDLSKAPDQVEFLDGEKTGWFIKGAINLLGGRGGIGKGAFAMGHVAVKTQKAGGLVFLLNEEDLEPTVINRMKINSGSAKKEDLIWMERREEQDGYSPIFSLKDDLPDLRKKLTSYSSEIISKSILIIDSIGSFLGMKRGSDTYNDVEVRRVLMPLAQLAKQFSLTIIIVAHFNKNRYIELADAVMGSVAFSNVCRACYGIIADQEDEDRKYFLPIKVNIAEAKNTGLEFKIEESPADRITIVKELTKDEVRSLRAEREPGELRSLRPLEEAVMLIKRELFRKGQMTPKEIVKLCKTEEVCGRQTVFRAAALLRKEGFLRTDIDLLSERPVWVKTSASESISAIDTEDVRVRVERAKRRHLAKD